MEFLKIAMTAPLTNLGPAGMLIAVVLWVVALYFGVRYGYGARKPGGLLYVASFIASAIMLLGLCLMLFTREFENEHSAAFQFFGLVQLLTFGAVGGFVLVLSLACGFMFGVLIRVLDALTQKTMR